jgi:uncharacterized metal-binding protein YceD (DUF177 family)
MGKFTEFKLMLKSLPMGKHRFEYHLNREFFMNMENDVVRDADINVTLDVTHRAEGYVFEFQLKGSLTVACDRCLDDLTLPVDTVYNLNVRYGEDYNDESDTLLVIPENENYLNVAYLIYDTAVLAIPPRCVHPHGECNRAMTALNKKYTTNADDSDDEDAALRDELLEDLDELEAEALEQDED